MDLTGYIDDQPNHYTRQEAKPSAGRNLVQYSSDGVRKRSSRRYLDHRATQGNNHELECRTGILLRDSCRRRRLGPRATRVRRSTPVRQKSRSTNASTSNMVPLVVASLFVLFLIAKTLTGRLSLAVTVTYGVVSILTFLVYWNDKSAAQHGTWRTKESSLLLLGLAGGWPGAVVAQRVLRHKSRKQSFQVAFWGTVVMNSLALGWLLTDSGSNFLE
jgi:uncharacterized membrane protein YsdA (DUF1294 family)